ncbi:phage terminase large subunit family protein [Acinetobacter sp. YH01020]|uniref:phage terminase large subunit family protein n=1 Tax=Acinetobacter sp. YH01020 TaxID=2601034 RepID=UPI001C554620|nr:phage terminase large subunit family protein [Acinetobacter sp. YH01020]
MQNLLPPLDLKPSDWAEKNIKIPVGNAIPGPINFDNAPYQRGMIDAIKERGVRRISYMTGAQLGKTTVQQCATSYFIAHEPRSQIFVQPTQGDVQTFLETKLRPMLESNPEIASKMAKPRSHDGVNNNRMISYIGGWLLFSWAGSPKTLRGRSAPVTHADEVDGMQATTEGDPVELLSQRAATFGDQALRTESSTPTVAGASRIENAFKQGDMRRYYVPCPHCGEAQFLRWENVIWQGRKSTNIQDAKEDIDQEHDVDTAGYRCECCNEIWSDGERIAAIRNAEKLGHGWKAEKPFKGHISFHAPEMLSTFRKMRDIVQSYLDKLALDDLQVFVNVSLGETYEENGDKADPEILQLRAEEYVARVPNAGVYLTCGIDMQMDRLELEIVAWGVGEESWSIDYRVLWGDPLGDEIWEELDDILEATYLHESGAQLSVSAACLDTGGTAGYTQRAYEYVKSRRNRKLFAIKGRAGWGMPIVQSPQRKQSGKDKRKVDLFIVGVDEAKLTVMRRLDLEKKGPGYCHFPHDREMEWYRQLTAEKLIIRYVKGQPIREWHKPDRARNEALDCRVYALAALKIMQPNLKRISERVSIDIGEVEVKNEVRQNTTVVKKVLKRKIIKKTTVPVATSVAKNTVIKRKRIFGNKK